MPPLPSLKIRIKKSRDGTAALSCTRADGTVTWQKQRGAQGAFFPRHDLTHYAVETILGHRRGFYGLVSEGWDFSDFGTPWPRGPMPDDMDPSELIVGFFDAERATRNEWTASDLTEKVNQFFANQGAASDFEITDDQLVQIRQRMRELFSMWEAVPPGEALELPFEVPAIRG